MKKLLPFMVMTLVIITALSSGASFSEDLINDELRYGLRIGKGSSDGINDLTVDDIFIYSDQDDYVVTVQYSGGDVETVISDDMIIPKSSFFNPPSGDIVMVSWLTEPNRIYFDESLIQYRVDKAELIECDSITIMIFDKKFPNTASFEERVIYTFYNNGIDFDKIPDINELTIGYEFDSVNADKQLVYEPSVWAVEKLEELKVYGTFRDSAFDSFNQGITRQRFVYLMVELYESLSGKQVSLNTNVSFSDTTDIYALKAAQLGITSGIGNNQFGPDIILTREQMATFVVKTLQLAGVDFDPNSLESNAFGDHDQISDWAKESIYISRSNEIINGVGNNEFAPKQSATNEQSLVLIHSILSRFGDLRLYKEIDKDRVYVRYADNIYKIPFEENILVNKTTLGNDLYLESFDDIDQLLSIAHTSESALNYTPTQNPNIKGEIIPFTAGKLTLNLTNLFFGVDKIGEQSSLIMTSDYSTNKYVAMVKSNTRTNLSQYEGFDKVIYYDTNNNRMLLDSIPIQEAFGQLGIEYSLEYNRLWNVYIIEF